MMSFNHIVGSSRIAHTANLTASLVKSVLSRPHIELNSINDGPIAHADLCVANMGQRNAMTRGKPALASHVISHLSSAF